MSSDFSTKKINNVKVGKVPTKGDADTRPIKGSKLFSELYSNIFLCAKKKKGKTSVLYNTVKHCCGPDTRIIAFCSTLYKDASWETIKDWAEHKGIAFVGHTSLKDDNGVDMLQELVDGLSRKPEEEKKAKSFFDSDSEDEDEPRRRKYRAPEYLIILDDLSTELKQASVTALLKKNRHFKAKIIISSQYLNDLKPEARKQIDNFILFEGHSFQKIEDIYRDADISIPIDEFWRVYKFATDRKYSFLYIDCTTGEFRKNFNELIHVEE